MALQIVMEGHSFCGISGGDRDRIDHSIRGEDRSVEDASAKGGQVKHIFRVWIGKGSVAPVEIVAGDPVPGLSDQQR